ncbi:MAG: hypothetical protein NTZ78_02475 [Candidatus Aureabacteria bacterium]|nr:hypothetical protein [Candidatus Auribacterota bacterium]
MKERDETPWLATQAVHWCIVAVITAIGAVWLLHKGPVPVIRITTPLQENSPYWYILSPFPILGMLVAELTGLLATHERKRAAVELGVAIAVLVVVSCFRLSLCIPLSGHSMLFSYFILRRAFLNGIPIALRKAQLWVAIIMGLILLYLKLVWWTDPITLTAGAMAGALLFAASRAMLAQIG